MLIRVCVCVACVRNRHFTPFRNDEIDASMHFNFDSNLIASDPGYDYNFRAGNLFMVAEITDCRLNTTPENCMHGTVYK